MELADIAALGIGGYAGYTVGDVGLKSMLSKTEWFTKRTEKEQFKAIGVCYALLAFVVYKFGPQVKLDGWMKLGATGFFGGIAFAAFKAATA